MPPRFAKWRKKPIGTVKKRLGSLRRQPVNLGIKRNTEEFRINLCVAYALFQDIGSAIGWNSPLVGPLGGRQHVENIANGHHLGLHWNLIRAQPERISVVLRARGTRLRGDFLSPAIKEGR